MGNRIVPLTNNEYYHVYNRGVDKRDIVVDKYDSDRFLMSLKAFNTVKPIGSLFQSSLPKYSSPDKDDPLVEIVAYCLNPNHYHLILKQVADNGISEFMKRVSGGYTWHFNKKYKRSGVLFQGRFKSVHIDNDNYLKHLSAYVNLNFKVHKLSNSKLDLVRSSWSEYVQGVKGFCKKDIILCQFGSRSGYRTFAQDALKSIIKNKEEIKRIELGG